MFGSPLARRRDPQGEGTPAGAPRREHFAALRRPSQIAFERGGDFRKYLVDFSFYAIPACRDDALVGAHRPGPDDPRAARLHGQHYRSDVSILARYVFLALAGLDAGSAFGGMGSSREMAIAALAEPTVMIAIFAIALRAGTTSLDGIITRFAAEPLLDVERRAFAGVRCVLHRCAGENGRLPVDNPATHLELTMIHEAMILEYSGRHARAGGMGRGNEIVLVLDVVVESVFSLGRRAHEHAGRARYRISWRSPSNSCFSRGHCVCWKQRSPSCGYSVCRNF